VPAAVSLSHSIVVLDFSLMFSYNIECQNVWTPLCLE